MRKKLALILSLLMVFSFSSCGTKDEAKTDEVKGVEENKETLKGISDEQKNEINNFIDSAKAKKDLIGKFDEKSKTIVLELSEDKSLSDVDGMKYFLEEESNTIKNLIGYGFSIEMYSKKDLEGPIFIFKDGEIIEDNSSDIIGIGTILPIGKDKIILKSARIAKDTSGKDAVVFNFTWSNNSEETSSFIEKFIVKAFQDGEELEMGILLNINNDNNMKKIRSGNAINDIEMGFYTITDSKGDIEIEISEFLDFDGEPLELKIQYPENN